MKYDLPEQIIARPEDLASLLRWNYTDGVDNFERRRNQYVYSSTDNPNYYQGNRNPFVDHPEYVWTIFGGGNNNSQLSVATPNQVNAYLTPR